MYLGNIEKYYSHPVRKWSQETECKHPKTGTEVGNCPGKIDTPLES